mgnify:CR=1 FL=1
MNLNITKRILSSLVLLPISIYLIIKGTNLNGSFDMPLSKTQKKLDIKTFDLIRLEYKMWQKEKMWMSWMG